MEREDEDRIINEYREALRNMYVYFKDVVEYYILEQEFDWAAAAISRMPDSSAKVRIWDIYDMAGGDSGFISNFLETSYVPEERVIINRFNQAKSNYLKLPFSVIKRNKNI